jgi:hypothetical protein
MDGEGTLTMTFDETMSTASLSPTQITFQDDATSTTTYVLTGGTFSSLRADDSTVLVLTLNKVDRDFLTQDTDLAISKETTWITITATAAVDMNSKQVVGTTKQAELYTADTTEPTLASFEIDMDALEISFVFSETMNLDSFLVGKVTIVGTNGESYALTGGRQSSAGTHTTGLTWELSDTDANSLKRLRSTAVSEGTSGILFAAGTINDATNVNAVPTFTVAKTCNLLTKDTTDPELLSSDFDLTAGTITMEFSETIKSSTLVAVGVTIYSGQGSVVSYDLQANTLKVDLDADASSETRSDWLTAVLALSETDMNEIKRLTGLAVSDVTTYLSITSAVITDMNDNSVKAILPVNAQKTTDFTKDLVAPVLRSFDLDMSNRLLKLYFSETMLATSLLLDDSATTIEFASGTKVALTSTSANVVTDDSNVVTIKISEADANNMKIQGAGRTSDSDSNLKLFASRVYDMNNNPVDVTALSVTTFVADTVAPVMRSVDVDMDAGTLTITFDETVNTDSFDATTITVTNQAEDVTHTLVGGSVIVGTDGIWSPTVVIELVDTDLADIRLTDLNEIKLKTMLTKLSDSYVHLAEGTFTDTSVAATANVFGTKAANAFNVDGTSPNLKEFSFDLTESELTLTFDEVVDANKITATAITFWSHASDQDATDLGVTRSSHTILSADILSSNGLRITLDLSKADSDILKTKTDLFVNEDSSYLTITPAGVYDMAVPGNNVVEIISTDALKASFFVNDKIHPVVTGFDLDMDSELLKIYFSETVDSSSIVYTAITLQQTSSVGTTADQKVTLSTGSVTHVTDLTSVEIKLVDADLNKLKTRKIGMNKGSTYLTMSSAAIIDMARLEVVARVDSVDAEQVGEYTPDGTDPELESCTLDITAETFTLTFSETVDASSVIVAGFSLAQDAAGAQNLYALHAPSATTHPLSDSPIVVVGLSLTDMNEIKRLSELGLANDAASVWCSVESSFITDVFDNDVVAIASNSALASTNFNTDNTAPTLNDFDLDMNVVVNENNLLIATATLLFRFSETVLYSSYKPGEVTIQKASAVANDGSSSVTLQGKFEDVTTQSGTTISFKLLNTDTNAIKAISDLASEAGNSFVSFTSDFVTDMYNNPVTSIETHVARPVKTAGYVEDTTAPELINFAIDMNAGTMTLTFDETVDGRSFNPDEVTIRDSTDPNNFDASHKLTGALNLGGDEWIKVTNARTFVHAASHIIKFKFVKTDLDEIKRLNMCTENNDCYMVHTEFLMYDTEKNDVLRCT